MVKFIGELESKNGAHNDDTTRQTRRKPVLSCFLLPMKTISILHLTKIHRFATRAELPLVLFLFEETPKFVRMVAFPKPGENSAKKLGTFAAASDISMRTTPSFVSFFHFLSVTRTPSAVRKPVFWPACFLCA